MDKKTSIKINLYHLKSFNNLDSSNAQTVLSIATPKIKKNVKKSRLFMAILNQFADNNGRRFNHFNSGSSSSNL
jgi:methyltransferase-like protein